MNIPGTQTVTVVRRVRQRDPDDPEKWARDDRGNAVYADTLEDVPGCSVQPGSSNESNDADRSLVTSQVTIYAPPSWPAGALDALLIDGARYELIGSPLRWRHPRIGHVVVTAQEVTG